MSGELSPGDLAGMLRKAEQLIDREVAKVVKSTAQQVASTQQELIPKRSGKTARSVKATGPGGAAFTATTTEAEIGPTFFVGRFIEKGTSELAPRPFVEQSAEPHEPAFRQGVAEAMTTGALKGLVQ